jgi:DNA-binding winged helix-turn-helix (wHTH) protein/TolB-like protein/Tfp pilus assembly protein PilF
MTDRRLFAIGPFRLDPVDRLLSRDGRPVPLTPKAIDTLLVLVNRRGRLVAKDDLLREVWPDTFVEENNLAQHISTLRRVLGEGLPDGPVIETVPRRGYRFVGPVVDVSEETVAPVAPVAPASAAVESPGEMAIAPQPARLRRLQAFWALALVAPLMLVLMAAWPPGTRPPAAAGAAPSSAPLTRIAILPFANYGAPGDNYFAAGMTEEITRRLAGLRGVAVPSSATITGYDRQGKSLRRIGADLGVDFVVEGAAQWDRSGPSPVVRITLKLIRVADDTTLWSQAYESTLSSVNMIQAEIAFQIAGALQVAIAAGERDRFEKRVTLDTDAYLAYLRGIAAVQLGPWDTANLVSARTNLEDAVARDPNFAVAWSWLARVYSLQHSAGAARTPETRTAAHRAARRAIALEPGLPDARLGLAHLLLEERDVDAARRELDLVGVSLPNSPERWRLIGLMEQSIGRWSESQAAYERAFELDPVSTAEFLGVHYLHLRDYTNARRYIDLAMAANRSGATVPAAWARFSADGDVAGARQVLEAALTARRTADARVRGLLARLEWFDGRYDRALELIGDMDDAGSWLPANFRFPASVASGQVYESMGRTAEAKASFASALAALERRRQAVPDDYQVEAAMGLAAAGLGLRDEAVRHARRAVDLLPVSRDAARGPLYLYLLAQVQSRTGDQRAALATLDTLFSIPGFYNEHWVRRDPWFAAFRAAPGFEAHVARWATRKGAHLVARGTTEHGLTRAQPD